MAKTDKITISTELADAISAFNIAKVSNLLADDGEYAIQNEKKEIVLRNKNNFLDWMGQCFHEFQLINTTCQQMNYTIIQCLHSVTGNPVIIFNNGTFPDFSGNKGQGEKSGLVIKSENDKIVRIELCVLVMKTESPFIYEKRNLRNCF